MVLRVMGVDARRGLQVRMRGLRAAGGLALVALALAGCSGGIERIEPNQRDENQGSGQVPEAPEAESVIEDLFAAIEGQDADRLHELMPDHDDVDVRVPDVAPELVEIGEISGNSGGYDGASTTVPVTYSIAGEQAQWDAQLRYVSRDDGDPAWQVTNAIVRVETPSSGGSGAFDDYKVAPVNGELELDSEIDSLPGAYSYEVTPPTSAFEVTSDAEQVPVFVGERENDAPPTASEIAEGATVELSAEGIDLVAGKYADDVSMCANWCDEPADNKWQAISWSQADHGTGIFTITSAPGAASVTPIDRDAAGDWATVIAEQGDTSVQFAEVGPVSVTYSQVTCSGASSSNCSVSSSSGLPIDREGVRLLYAVGTDGAVTLVDVLGNT